MTHLCLLLDAAGGSGYPGSWLDVGLEQLGHPGDPLEVDGFPTSSSFAVLPSESSPTETDREAVQEAEYPGGGSGSLPAYGAEAEGMRAAAMPVIAKPGQGHRGRVYEVFQTDSDVDTKRPPSISPTPGSQSGFETREVLKYFLIGTAVVAITVLIAVLLCWVRMRRQQRKEWISAASTQQLETISCPASPQTWSSCPSTPEYEDEHQQLLPPCSPPASPPSLHRPPPSCSASPSPAALMPHDPPSTLLPLCPTSPSPSHTFYTPPSSPEPQPEQPPQPLHTPVEASSKGTRRPIKVKWQIYRPRTFHHQFRGTEFSPRIKRDRVLR
ncbi:protein PRRC2C [Athene cunicularia]|uniref:protein PRRC2C n=1 Tax=Athene cunicularia TaxID=194338 RepID=UPI000EF6ED50|nr:protein PRRC2C [Athene cunicularia]